jgi:hypothetical protein
MTEETELPEPIWRTRILQLEAELDAANTALAEANYLVEQLEARVSELEHQYLDA